MIELISTKFHRITYSELLLILIIFFSSCNENHVTSQDAHQSGNLFISRAERFKLEKKGDLTILTIINPWQGAKDVNQNYLLLKKGSDIPVGIDSSEIIFVPVNKIICMSTTHLAMISALREENTVGGVSGKGFIYSDELIKNVDRGHIKDVGYEGNLNKELILNISPDLVMMYGIGSESSGYVGKIEELGVKVVFNADYLETDPLAKAEWIKLFGALYCKESLADSIFNHEVEEYNNLKSFIAGNISSKPEVLLGLPFKDTWYVSPGNSFISKMIEDAGGEYLWHDTESSVSMPFGIENVYMRALEADYWLNIGSAESRDEISVVDMRLNDLTCFRKGNLYNNNNRTTINGGNDYWERGTVYPHLILKDIAAILHPDLFSDHKLLFYRKIY
jgi:iron complex transport system substrate-binding protein